MRTKRASFVQFREKLTARVSRYVCFANVCVCVRGREG